MTSFSGGFFGIPRSRQFSPGVSGLVLLDAKKVTNGDAAINFLASIDASYGAYQIHCHNIQPVTDLVDLWIRVFDGIDGTLKTGAADYGYVAKRTTSAPANADLGNVSAGAMVCQVSLSNVVAAPQHLIIHVVQPASTSKRTIFTWHGGHYLSATPSMNWDGGAGLYQSSTPITGVQLALSAGVLAAGEAFLYGIRTK